MDIPKQHVEEVLDRLHDYFYWMYYDDRARDNLGKVKLNYQGFDLTFDIDKETGFIIVNMDGGVKCVYDVRVSIRKPINGLDNLDIQTRIINQNELSKENLEFFGGDFRVFVGSYFQRSIAGIFWARMQKETREHLVNVMLGCNRK